MTEENKAILHMVLKNLAEARAIVVMGVAGSGKTTIGMLLSEKLQWSFADADSFHSAANVAKMSSGLALTDQDRQPWLEKLRSVLSERLHNGESIVLACSALKASYRDTLHVNNHVSFVYLKGDFGMLSARLSQRHGHFMKTQMLESQLETLEEPTGALIVDAGRKPADIVDEIIAWVS